MPDRREFLIALGAGAALFLCSPSSKGRAASEVAPGEMALGPEDAPVTIIEYFSLTCGHCASFHRKTFATLKEAYIDTGKVRFISRDFPLDEPALRAAMLARCSGPERYFGFIATMYDAFDHWTEASNPISALAQIAMLGGIGREEFEACITDPELETVVLNSYVTGTTEYGVEYTPTFIINGRKFEGDLSFQKFKKILEPLLAGS